MLASAEIAITVVFISFVIIAACGFAILIRAFGKRAAWSGIVLFPVMLYALDTYSVLVAAYVYGDPL
jgi:hypothetical protein